MSINNINLIDPAYVDVKLKIREGIKAYLDNLSEEEKREYGISLFKPVIPPTKEQINDFIRGWVELYEPTSRKEQNELKAELIEHCQSFGLEINQKLPLAEFQSAMRQALEQTPGEHLLEVGVFGVEVTQTEVDQTREMMISSYTTSIQQAAYDELLSEIGKKDDSASDNYKVVSDMFPELVQLVKDNLKRRNLLN